ncbi:MAG TPA: hypothetical protein VMX56_02360, partial [Anaerolineales bacterium]|nr:hypothetical protein [Anaerolineales bacterium]
MKENKGEWETDLGKGKRKVKIAVITSCGLKQEGRRVDTDLSRFIFSTRGRIARRMKIRLYWPRLLGVALALISILGYLGLGVPLASAAIITWDGGGTTNNWSEAANWSLDVVPGSADTATFDGTSIKPATIDASINVGGINISAGYTGTITQANGV